MTTDTTNSKNGGIDLDVIVVGGGIGGLYTLYKMRGLGLTARAFEAGSGLGGTWFWNRYPGCRCDIESLEYSFSFSPELEQEWHWPERYGTQPADPRVHRARRRPLRPAQGRDARTPASLTAHFDSAANLWTMTTDKGESRQRAVHRHGDRQPLDAARAGLRRPRELQGRLVPHRPVAARRRRLHRPARRRHRHRLVRRAEHPAHRRAGKAPPRLPAHRQLHPAGAQRADGPGEGARAQGRRTASGARPPTTRPSASRATRRRARAPSRPRRRSARPPTPRSGSTAAASASSSPTTTCWSTRRPTRPRPSSCAHRIRETVNDPATAELLCPTDHPIGTKRLILDTNYYETFNRDNVTLVDARSAPIERITPTGLRTTEASYEFDAIVFATGFDAMTGALREIDIRGRHGRRHPEQVGGRSAHLPRPHDGGLPQPLHGHGPAEPAA